MPRARKPRLDDMTPATYGNETRLVNAAQATQAAAQAASILPGQGDQVAPFVSPDEVPNLSDVTSRPGEPLTTGLDIGPGDGSNILQPTGDPVRRTLQAILLVSPQNHGAQRLLDMLNAMGR